MSKAQNTTSSPIDPSPRLGAKILHGELGIANVLKKFKHRLKEYQIWSTSVLARNINDRWISPSYPTSLDPNAQYSYYSKDDYIYIVSLNITASADIALPQYRATIIYEG